MKRRPHFLVGKLVVILLGTILLAGATGLAQEQVFIETFDDVELPGWERSPNAGIVDGVLRIVAEGYAFHPRPGEGSDLNLTVIARRSGEGGAAINYNVGERGDYSLLILEAEIILHRAGTPMAQGPMEPIPPGEWFVVHVVTSGGNQEIIINGQVVLVANDPDPLPAGGIWLAAHGPATAEFEQLELVTSGGGLPPGGAATDEPAAAAPAQEFGLEAPSGDFAVERVLRYFDDMENANFDAIVPLRGSGSYQVVAAGAGDLAARLHGSIELEMSGAAWPARTWVDYDLIVRTKKAGAGTVGYGFRWLTFSPDAPTVTDFGYWLESSGAEWSVVKDMQGTRTTLHTATGPNPVDAWFELTISVRSVAEGTHIEVYVDSQLLLAFLDPDGLPYGGFAFFSEGSGAELWLDDVQVIEYVDTRYTWQQTGGPEGAYDLGGIAVDPRDWRVVYAGGLDSDLFKSTDGGQSWTMIGLPNELWTNRFRIVKLAPSNPDIVYVGAGGKHISPFWRSDDGGDSWHWMDVGANEFLREGDTHGLTIDPDDAMHVFFTMGSGLGVVPPEYTGIYETVDGGETFSHIYSGAFIGPIELDPGNRRHLLAGSLNAAEDGFSMLASHDGGRTWSASDSGITGDDIARILFHPDDPNYVYAVAKTFNPEAGANAYRSTDGGSSWHVMNSLPTANLILATHETPSSLLAFGFGTVSTSSDKGETWSHQPTSSCSGGIGALGSDDPSVLYIVNSPNIMLSKDLGASCTATSSDGFLAHAIMGIGIAPSDPAVVYAATMSGVYVSRDFGETWTFLKTHLYAGVAVDPSDSNTVYLGGIESNEILKSTDGGTTWTNISGPIEYPGVATLVIDPNDSDTIYAGTGHGPQFGPGGAGLYKSTDGGDSWTRLPGIPDAAVTSVVIDRLDSDIVVAAAMGLGVFVSHDGGESFAVRNRGLTTSPSGETVPPNVWALALDPRDPQVIYAGTTAHSGHGAVGGYPAIYKTTDGGHNWRLLLGWASPGEYQFMYFGGGVDALAVNPARPDEIYVALHDPGIIFSENGGEDWRFANHGLVPLMTHLYPYRMAISADGDILYATTCGRSLYRNLVNGSEEVLPDTGTTLEPPGIAARHAAGF